MRLACALGVSVWLAVAAVSVAPSVAAAQPVGADEEARQLFQDGRRQYDAGQFEEALRSFRRAYVLSNRFGLLYNVGQTALRMGRDAEALDAFEAFLRQAPDDDANRAEVTERVRMLRTMVPQSGTTTTTTTTTTEPETTEPEATEPEATEPATTEPEATATTSTTTSTAAVDAGGGGPSAVPWIVVGAGAAVAIVGAVLLGVASSDAARVTGATDGATWSELSGVADGASSMWTAGQVMVGVGAAVLAAGVVWGVVDLTSSGGSGERAEARTRTRLRVGLGSIGLEGSF